MLDVVVIAVSKITMEIMSSSKVCVTGSAGYIGSHLVKKLLERGYTVHATVRNLNDKSKVGLLRSFPFANTRLRLFEADFYKPQEFEEAIEGCQFVFHFATPAPPIDGGQQSKYRIEATVAALRSIAMSCINSGTVRRLIYTSSVMAASPLRDDGTGFKESMDETCWTPLNLTFAYRNDYLREYTYGKTLAEKEIWEITKDEGIELEVVTLPTALVGGKSHLSYVPESVGILLSQVTGDPFLYDGLKVMEELLGKVPVAHIEDVCRAHIFCMETPSINGRFLCASSYVHTSEIANYYHKNYPELHVKPEHLEGPKRDIQWGSGKLYEKGFVYKYDIKMILDECLSHARSLGDL